MFSGFWRDSIIGFVNDVTKVKQFDYCYDKYHNDYDKSSEDRVEACQTVRSVSWGLLDQVHRSTMQYVIDFVEHYHGIEPAKIREEKKESEDTKNQVPVTGNPDAQPAPATTEKKTFVNRWVQSVKLEGTHWKLVYGFEDEKDAEYPNEFVERVWTKNDRTDISFVLLAATYLNIETLAALCGAKTALEIQKSQKNGTFEELAKVTLDEPWFLSPI